VFSRNELSCLLLRATPSRCILRRKIFGNFYRTNAGLRRRPKARAKPRQRFTHDVQA
jgi:hypothetical protein